jgi:hypothetical protein
LISKETLDKFIADIQKDVEELDKKSKEKAEASLTAAFDGFRQRLAERIANEKRMLDECRRVGDDMGARHHETLLEIYKSLSNIDNKPIADST